MRYRIKSLYDNKLNLQQVPSKNKDIRNIFIAGENRVYVGIDFSQQEMLCVASLAKDQKMLDSFNLGRDIYSHVASIAFNVPYEDCEEFEADGVTVKPEGKRRRKMSKAICLGIVYGKGVKAIAEDLNVTKEKAQEIKDSVLKEFPDLARYLERVVEFGRKHGYVENFYGGRRRLPDLNLPEYEISGSKNITEDQLNYYKKVYLAKLKNAWGQEEKKDIIEEASKKGIEIKQNGGFIAQAERLCYNYPVQSTAAYITKRSMLNVANNNRLNELDVFIDLTIHDELIINVPKQYLEEALKIIKKEFLAGGVGIDATLRCDIEVSECWCGEPYVDK